MGTFPPLTELTDKWQIHRPKHALRARCGKGDFLDWGSDVLGEQETT